ncbi:MAG TPA: methylmalonyl Co-A mutase-associated GTPase MeaB [Thermoplasmata archaeon]|nr:methylmalonyl Co-A mutase-associated GTPase MeaB [Thermoplasmata archaeon]
MKGAPPLPPLARAVVAGDRRALAKAISAIENGDPAAVPALRALYPRTGRAMVVGITGPLGVGKSTLLNALVAHLRGAGRTVGVVAVDPSSPFTGGSVLGDRIRFARDADDAGVFFRSMASRGEEGGVARATQEVVRLLDAAGFDIVLVETVGSGQVDVAIRGIASTSIVVVVPHLGDEVQTLKAGLFEIADVFCVNKSDLPGADLARRDLAELVALGRPRDGWAPPIVLASAIAPSGIDELWRDVEAHERFLDADGRRAALERRRLAREIVGLVQERVGRELGARLERDPELSALLERVVRRTIDPRAAADRLLPSRPARSRTR